MTTQQKGRLGGVRFKGICHTLTKYYSVKHTRFGKLPGYTMNYDIQYIGTDLLMEILLIHPLVKGRKDTHKRERIACVKP